MIEVVDFPAPSKKIAALYKVARIESIKYNCMWYECDSNIAKYGEAKLGRMWKTARLS